MTTFISTSLDCTLPLFRHEFRFLNGSTADVLTNTDGRNLQLVLEEIIADADARNLWEENADIISKSLPDDYDPENWIELGGRFIQNAWSDVSEVPADYSDALDALFHDSFMQPTFQQGVFYTWEDADTCADVPEEYQDLVDIQSGVLC